MWSCIAHQGALAQPEGLTCSPGVWVFQGKGQTVVYSSQLDDGLLHNHPVAVLEGRRACHKEAPLTGTVPLQLSAARIFALATIEVLQPLTPCLQQNIVCFRWEKDKAVPCRPHPKDAQVQQHQFPRNRAQLHPNKVSLGHKPPMQRATKSPGDKIRSSHTWNPSQLGKAHPSARQAACRSRAPHGATHPHARAVQGTVILDEPVVIAPICREIKPAMSVPGPAGTTPSRRILLLRPRNETNEFKVQTLPQRPGSCCKHGKHHQPPHNQPWRLEKSQLTRKWSACKPQSMTLTTASLAGIQKPSSPGTQAGSQSMATAVGSHRSCILPRGSCHLAATKWC